MRKCMKGAPTTAEILHSLNEACESTFRQLTLKQMRRILSAAREQPKAFQRHALIHDVCMSAGQFAIMHAIAKGKNAVLRESDPVIQTSAPPSELRAQGKTKRATGRRNSRPPK
tara:strand:- start:563 stop:904 length:342 start_codon:yes stop_codon:yes gene_type:complete